MTDERSEAPPADTFKPGIDHPTDEELATAIEALDDETMCFDGKATYDLLRLAASRIRALGEDKAKESAAADMIAEEREAWKRSCAYYNAAAIQAEARAEDLQSQLSQALATIGEMRGALEPFAAMADALDDWPAPPELAVFTRRLKSVRVRQTRQHTYVRLMVEHFRRARSLLQPAIASQTGEIG